MNNDFAMTVGLSALCSMGALRGRKLLLQRPSIRQSVMPRSIGLLTAWIGFLLVISITPIDAYADSPATLTTLYSFPVNDGTPFNPLIQGADGNFYGITNFVGSNGPNYGTFFRITPSGTETTLHTFTSGAEQHVGAGTLSQGHDGNFYVVSYGDGANNFGGFFKITPSGSTTTVHSFTKADTAYAPSGKLVEGSDGNFYGTSTQGTGSNTNGAIIRITPRGTMTTVYKFSDTDPQGVFGDLVLGKDGNFYGMANNGASAAVFRITLAGALSVVHTLSNSDGVAINYLFQDLDGTLYGSVLSFSGAQRLGTIFKITPNGAFTTLYSLPATGTSPLVNYLVFGSDGNLYGTTIGSGAAPSTIFQFNPNGIFTVLYAFSDSEGIPLGLVQAGDGNFYGTTLGRSAVVGQNGTAFKLFVPASPKAQLVDPIPLTHNDKSLLAQGGKLIASKCTDADNTNCNLLATQGRLVKGASADGVTQLLIRIPANTVGESFTLSLSDQTESGTPSTDDDGGLTALGTDPLTVGVTNTVTVTAVETKAPGATTSRPMAFAIYRAPVDFIRPQTTTISAVKAPYVMRAATSGAITGGDADLASRTVKLQIAAGTGVTGSTSIAIVRPPVVLVHGLWAEGNATDLRSLWNLQSDPLNRFDVEVADYGSLKVEITDPQPNDFPPSTINGSQLGLDFAASVTESKASDVLLEFRSGKNPIGQSIAGAQADFVAHSMGSLVVRELQHIPQFKSPQNFNQGYIHKEISLGGPHLGSPVALNLLKRGRAGDGGVDNRCTRIAVATLEGYYAIESYKDSEGNSHSGAIADLSGQGDGTQLSDALKTLKAGGSIHVAYVAGEMDAQSLAALDGVPEDDTDNYIYKYGVTSEKRLGTNIDELKNYLNGYLSLFCDDYLTSVLTAEDFKKFMGDGTPADSDGIVPLYSQRNGQVKFVDLGYGFVHSGGAALLGFGTVDLQGDSPVGHVKTLLDDDAEAEAVNLLNTSIRDPIYVPGQ